MAKHTYSFGAGEGVCRVEDFVVDHMRTVWQNNWGEVLMQDIRDEIFSSISTKQYTATIIAEQNGIVAGMSRLQNAMSERGLTINVLKQDGDTVTFDTPVASSTGSAKNIALVEEFAIGTLAKSSGIATAALQAKILATPHLRVVCGGWKKMPPEIKNIVREAVAVGGITFRITDKPFIYLDKNYVRMLGGVGETLAAVKHITDKIKVIQIKGEFADVADEALIAANNGAEIIMVDTGAIIDVDKVNGNLIIKGCRSKVQLAFAKGIKLDTISQLINRGIDILDIGAGIIDAPLLDMRLDVTVPL